MAGLLIFSFLVGAVLDLLDAALALLQDQGTDVLVHCGDLTGPDIVHVCAALPCYFV